MKKLGHFCQPPVWLDYRVTTLVMMPSPTCQTVPLKASVTGTDPVNQVQGSSHILQKYALAKFLRIRTHSTNSRKAGLVRRQHRVVEERD